MCCETDPTVALRSIIRNMVDTSGSSNSSTIASDSESSRMCLHNTSMNDTTVACARKKKPQQRKSGHRKNSGMVDNTDTITIADGDDNDDDDKKIPSTSPCNLGPYDVICGRNKMAFNNIGNRRFRFTIALALPRFLTAKSRKDKSIVIESIKKLVHQNGGRFLLTLNDDEENTERDTNGNIDLNTSIVNATELDAKQSHLKVGHALRDAERKLTKAQQQQQKQRKSQERVANDHLLPPSDPKNSMIHANTSDPLLFHQTDSWDLEEYDTASISSISCIDGGIASSSFVISDLQRQPPTSAHPSLPFPSTIRAANEPFTLTEHHQIEMPIPHRNYDPNLYQRQQHLINAQQYPTHSRPPMPSTIDSQTQIPINNGRLQQVQQPVSFHTNASMTMNDDDTNIPISWTGIRCRTNGKFQVQPAQPMLLLRGRAETSSVSDDYNIVSEQYHHVHFHHNDDDDHHQNIMSWLVDESEEIIDDARNISGT